MKAVSKFLLGLFKDYLNTVWEIILTKAHEINGFILLTGNTKRRHRKTCRGYGGAPREEAQPSLHKGTLMWAQGRVHEKHERISVIDSNVTILSQRKARENLWQELPVSYCCSWLLRGYL